MEYNVLDHGYLKLIEAWGSDERIIEAARMSTDKGFKGWGEKYHYEKCPNYGEPLTKKCDACEHAPGDEKLLAYLYRNKHATPFEMAGFVIEVKAPMFVFREWHRHRTQSYNEMSARYIPLPADDYVPTWERLFLSDGKNKQAASAEGSKALDAGDAEAWRMELAETYRRLEDLYQTGLSIGVPKELARLCIPVGRYSKMRASANLRNWLHFLTLRMDTNAQWEIRQYAEAVGKIIAEKFPRTWELFMEGRR